MPIKGKGVKFGYANTGTALNAATGYTLVANVMEATPPEGDMDDLDTTNHDTSGTARTFMSGLTDGGECEVTMHYDKTAFSALYALRGQDKSFQILFSDSSGIGFAGYIKTITSEHPLDGLASMTAKVKVSGDPDPFAAAGS